MAWIVKQIMEADYGCEEKSREELDQVIVLLTDENGESIRFRASDSMLYRMGIDEGDEWPEKLFPLPDPGKML